MQKKKSFINIYFYCYANNDSVWHCISLYNDFLWVFFSSFFSTHIYCVCMLCNFKSIKRIFCIFTHLRLHLRYCDYVPLYTLFTILSSNFFHIFLIAYVYECKASEHLFFHFAHELEYDDPDIILFVCHEIEVFFFRKTKKYFFFNTDQHYL